MYSNNLFALKRHLISYLLRKTPKFYKIIVISNFSGW